MATAAPRRTRPLTADLRESYDLRSARVDREQGIIYGVKIVGKSSPNRHGLSGVSGTEYTDDALLEESRLLEGVCVNVDHPDRAKPGKDRSARDRFAWLEKIEFRAGDGNFGDLHFLDPTDPLAVKMMNAAERKPDAYALSHNAVGRGEVRNGKYVVVSIPEVRSVDIVADGGTNRSLFEGREVASKKLRDLVESKRLRKRFRALLEDDAVGGMDMPMPEAGGAELDELDHLFQAFKKLKDSDPEKANKLLAMLKAELPEGDDEEEVEESDEECDTPPAKKDKAAMESRLRELEAREGCRQLCESEHFAPTAVQLDALVALSEPKRKALVKELKAGAKARPAGPRSQAPGVHLAESREDKVPEGADGKALGKWLKG